MGSSDTEAIEDVREAWLELFNEGRLDELGERFYAEDAWALPPGGAPIRGRSEVTRLFRELRESGDVRYELGVLETVAEGDLGYLVGTYAHTVDGQTVSGITLETYRRQADGTWKCVADMWTVTEPD